MEKDEKLNHLTTQLAKLNPQNQKLIATVTAQLKTTKPPIQTPAQTQGPAAPKTLKRKHS